MNIQDIFSATDKLFSEGKAVEAVELMERELAAIQGDRCATCGGDSNWSTELSLLNELMGYYRSTQQMKRAWEYANRVLEIMHKHDMIHTLDGATVQLNVASIYRDAGEPQLALRIYESVEELYLERGLERDIRLVALYNNMSVAAMDLNDIDKAYEYGIHALCQLEENADTVGERATILGNLAGLLLQKEEKDWETIDTYLEVALRLFREEASNDPHAGFVIATKAAACEARNDLEGALFYYEEAASVMERGFGKNENYKMFCEKCEQLKNKLS